MGDFELIRVSVEIPPGHEIVEVGLRARLAQIGLFRYVENFRQAELRICLLEPRSTASSGDPAPSLGSLEEPGWALTSSRGELLAPFHPAEGVESVEAIRPLIYRQAQRRALIRLTSPGSSRLRGRVRISLHKRDESRAWKAAPAAWSGGDVPYEDGQELAVEIENGADEAIYPYVFDLGLAGGLELIHPKEGEVRRIAAGGQEWLDRLCFRVPESFPFHAPGERATGGRETLLFFATTEPISETRLLCERCPHYPRAHLKEGSPLGRVLLAILQQGSPPPADALRSPTWMTASQVVALRRP